MNDPDLVVLDEPTDGLDPVGRKETRDALERLRSQGKTVFLNSHLLGKVERLCNRVAILVNGKVVRQGTVNELTAASTRYVIEIAGDDVDASGPRPAALPREKAVQAAIRTAIGCELAIIVPPETLAGSPDNNDFAEAGTLPSGEAVELVGTTLRIATDNARRIQPLLDALRTRNLVIRSVRPVPPIAGRLLHCGRVRHGSPDYFSAGGKADVTQTAAIFVDAYRSLNSRAVLGGAGHLGAGGGRVRVRGNQRAGHQDSVLAIR